MVKPVLIENLFFAYQKDYILKNISLSIEENDFVALIGPNGSGKTTLLSLLWAWLRPQEGLLLIEGQNIKSFKPKRLAQQIAQVSQDFRGDLAFTVWETVLLGRSPYQGLSNSLTDLDLLKAQEAISLTGIQHLKDRFLFTLSGGELKRVLIALALAQDTKILLLDEPTAHLDLHYEYEILLLLKKLQRERHIALIVTFHDLNLASLYADRVILLDKGQIVAVGKPEEVIRQDILEMVYGNGFTLLAHPLNGKPCVLPVFTLPS